MRKVLKGLLIVSILAIGLVGCGKKDDDKSGSTKKNLSKKIEATVLAKGNQFSEPKKGETVAEIVVKDYGSIYVKFFKKEAPKAVENFVKHAKDGYYNGQIFHRVINDFMIQGGDPTGTGSGGESIWKENFEDEFSDNLYPYRGALCMANMGANTNGSQFFIVQAKTVTEDLLKQVETDYQLNISDEVKDTYMKIGGTPWLHKAHTVFGQMIAGYDVLDAIATTETDDSDKPTKDVVIEKINIWEY